MEILSYVWQYIVEVFGLAIAYIFAAIFLFLVLRQFHSKKITAALMIMFIGVSIAFYIPNGTPNALANRQRSNRDAESAWVGTNRRRH